MSFVYRLVRYGEFARFPVVLRGESGEWKGVLTRRLVVAWTGSVKPWLDVEFESAGDAGGAVLRAAAARPEALKVMFSGAGTEMDAEARWGGEDRAMARDMLERCPRTR